MANVLAELFQNTANAIREKTGDTGTMKPAEFPDKIRAIETGGGVGNLISLTVTENGTYYPTADLAIGKTYSLKTTYTQEELIAFYNLSETIAPINSLSNGSMLFDTSDDHMLMVVAITMGETYYGVLVVNDNYNNAIQIWLPQEAATMGGIGDSEGWYVTADMTAFTPLSEIPTFTFSESGNLYVTDISDLNGLFDLPSADGFSSVTVNVENNGSVEDAVVWAVTFIGADGAVLYTRPCIDGDDCYDPITTGKIGTPTKDSTPQYNYTYNGWSLTDGGTADGNALTNVTADRTVYAAFIENLVYYTVRFFDGDTLKCTVSVPYGETAIPSVDIEKDGYLISGYEPTNENITADTDCYVQWAVDDGYIRDSYADIVKYANNGEAKTRYKVGYVLPQVPITYADGTVENMDFVVADFDKVLLADGTTKSNIIFVTKYSSSYFGARAVHTKNTWGVIYDNTEINTTLEEEVYNGLPSDLIAGIKQRRIYKNYYENRASNCWLLSIKETTGGDEVYNEQNRMDEQFGLFADDNSRVRYRNGTETAVKWWLRSYNYSSHFYNYYTIKSDGTLRSIENASNKNDVVFGFCL